MKLQVFEIPGILLEIPNISISLCEKPSISNFLISNTRFFDQKARVLLEMLDIFIETLDFLV